MKLRRSYLTYSLRTLFFLLMTLAVWVGIFANRAREQREAVKAIEALGGTVIYDWGRDYRVTYSKGEARLQLAPHSKPSGPAWMQEFSQTVDQVLFLKSFPDTDLQVRNSIPHLQRLQPDLFIVLDFPVSDDVYEELQAALPGCLVERRRSKRHPTPVRRAIPRDPQLSTEQR